MPQGPSFWFDTRIYLAVAAALLLVIVFYNKYVAVLGAILLVVLYLYGRERHIEQQKAMNAYLDSMAHNVESVTTYALKNLPLAMALVDETGRLQWGNSVLFEWTDNQVKAGQSLLTIWPELPLKEMWGQSGKQVISVGGQYYQILYKPLETGSDGNLLILYIGNITDSETDRAACEAAMPVLAYIQIDNFDDVLQGLAENQRSDVLLEVNKLLSGWAVELDGFLKKYTEDSYIAIFSNHALDGVMNDRFEILDRIRTIRAGNKIPVTLSMGVVADESSYASMGERAQAGLDLALGRGGDQAVVHVDSKVQFYGGKAKAVEKNTRVKARLVSQAIRESMESSDMILVMGHVNEDFDSLGAALGVAKMARYLGKAAYIVVSPANLTVNKLSELFAEYAEYQNIFLTPSQATGLMTAQTLLFVVDTHREKLVAAPELLPKAERVIVIDHHRRSEGFINNPLLVYLEPSASSTSELVTELLMYFDDQLDLTRLDATVLYAGIVVDTKNFAVQAGVRTFDAAAYLRRSGADPALVRHLFRVDFDTMKAQAEVLSHTELLPGGVIIGLCSDHIKNAQIVAAQTADMLLLIEGTRLSFVLFPIEGGVGVSARSQGEINVQVIMEQLGGGGHQTVAGAQVKDATVEQVREKLLELVVNYIGESDHHEGNFTARS